MFLTVVKAGNNYRYSGEKIFFQINNNNNKYGGGTTEKWVYRTVVSGVANWSHPGPNGVIAYTARGRGRPSLHEAAISRGPGVRKEKQNSERGAGSERDTPRRDVAA